MLLQCTVAGGPGSAVRTPVEITVDLPSGCPGARLQEALTERFATSSLQVAGVPLSALTAGTPPLVNGAVLLDGFAPQAGAPAAAEPVLMLAVVGGPAAGTLLPLRRGSFRLGRSGADLVVQDPGLSREHAKLKITSVSATIEDLGSANGTWVDGRRISTAPLTTGAEIRCGNSTLELLGGGSGGQWPPPVPGDAGADTSAPLPLPAPPSAGHLPTLLVTSLLPLLAGMILTLVTGTWMFLAFTAFSALPVLVTGFTGRRRRRQWRSVVAAAALDDAGRRRRAAPSIASLVGAPAPLPRDVPRKSAGNGLHVPAGRPERPPTAGPVWLRLGLAEQTANVRPTSDTVSFRPPATGRLPVTLGPGTETWLSGPPHVVEGLLRSLVIQLAAYPRAELTRVHLLGPPGKLLLSARFLPRVVAATAEADAVAALRAAGPTAAGTPGVVICLPGYPASDALRAEAERLGWQVISCCPNGPIGERPGQALSLSAGTGQLTRASEVTEFVPDLVPEAVFDRFCRRRGGLPPTPRASGGIPTRCALQEVLPLTKETVARRWAATAPPSQHGLSVAVGSGADGPICVDLQQDGPHLLVAGTTGSGKSEFLRTLVVSLAAARPPSEVTFLFIDFKGGSGLGPLAGLPHCVGLLTDLDGHEIDRALVSLRAEVRRREQLLAGASVPDLASYRIAGNKATAPAHLVLVIDEFRMLVDEAPAALSELMRIAAIGRSLGIHLVMATQRPQGALTADIRANVTSTVVLRVQSDAESLDVMNAKLAAAIPTDMPGRAYLIRGNAGPEEFQTATLAGTAQDVVSGQVTVITADEFLTGPPLPASHGTGGPDGGPNEMADAAASFVELARTLWRDNGGGPAYRPVASPLPAFVTFPGPTPSPRPSSEPVPTGRTGFRLGIVDLPELQGQGTLTWSPAGHGHLALIGGSPQGRGTPSAGLRMLLAQWAAEANAFAYLLDADNSQAGTAHHPLAGAVVGPSETRRAARILARLSEEMTRRLAAPNVPAGPVLLAIQDWGSWVSAFRSGPYAWAEDLLQDLIRGGPAAGVSVIVTGDRELVTARFFASLPNRVFFAATVTPESRLLWPAVPKVRATPGRVVVSGPFADCRSEAAGFAHRVPPADRGVCDEPGERPPTGTAARSG